MKIVVVECHLEIRVSNRNVFKLSSIGILLYNRVSNIHLFTSFMTILGFFKPKNNCLSGTYFLRCCHVNEKR